MKRILSATLVLLMAVLPSLVQAKVTHLLPKPHEVKETNGTPFALKRDVTITYAGEAAQCALLEKFFTDNGCELTATGGTPITVTLVESIDGTYDYTLEGFDNESYTLVVTSNAIEITAVKPIGVIRAAQTLVQLAEGYGDGNAAIETVEIKDWAAFKLRGFMHDVGRSFISVDELKKHIDLLSRFKVNCFHWHFTENQAWRFEVKEYPALTSAESMTRFAGKYYTQEQCREVAAYAKERGIIIIPEIDMPGHSEAFKRAMGFDMQTDEGVEVLKNVLDEVADVFADAPYIHIGADEKAITYSDASGKGFLAIMTDYIHGLGKKVVVWNPISGVNINNTDTDMTQMWSSAGNKIAGRPNIDCRYNYTNHFDVFADVVGIYRSNIYYVDKGNAEVAGTISAYWNDRKTPTEEDIVKQNNMYANVIASAERAWIGGGKQYIEAGGTMLPNNGEEFDEFADWERRFLFHKANSLAGQPIPYVKQTNVRWRITDPFPNGGNSATVFPPEEEGKSTSADLLDESFTYNGNTYYTGMATGAGIYLRHTWGNNTLPTYYGSTNHSNVTSYAWTYVYSPTAQTVGAQIEFQNYGRSEKDKAPDNGKWDRKGSDIWINGVRIDPPTWENAGKSINNEVDLLNENFTARTPIAVTLKQGWNKVFIKLPYVGADGVRLNKWMFTCVFTDTEGKNAVEGLIYSPNQCKDEATEQVAAKISEMKRDRGAYIGTAVGLWPASAAAAIDAKIAEVEATYATEMTAEQREAQIAELETAWNSFTASLTPAQMNQPQEGKYYRLYTPLRGNRYPTGKGEGQAIVGEQNPSTNASIWKFVAGTDGSFDIVNFHDLTYISPASANNTALNTVEAKPAAGWTLKPANEAGYVIIVSGSAQFNQTNNSNQGFKVYNWGSGTNISDTGCKYIVEEVEANPDEEGAGVATETPAPFKTTTIVNGEFAQGTVWYTMQIGASQYIISDNGDASNIALQTSQTDLEDADLWCFTGNSEEGYKIYNKQAGPTKILASSSTMGSLSGYGGTGGSTYPTLQSAAALPEGYVGTWDLQTSDLLADTEGYFLILHGTGYAVNNFGNRGALAFWAEGKDANSTVTFTFAEATIEIKESTGEFTASNSNKTWHSRWESEQLPGLTLGLNANNMQAVNGYLAIYSGQSRSCTHTLTAPEGCIIAEYSFDYVNLNSDASYSLTLNVNGSSYTTSAEKKSMKVENGETRSTIFTQTGENKGITFSNYLVTVRRFMQEPEEQFDIFITTATSIPYRIPAIAKTQNGNLIAVADYRHSGADIGMATNGRIDIRGRISKDNGKTWGTIFSIIEGQGAAAAANNSMYVAFGDPCLVADSESPKVMLLTCSGNVSFPNGQRNNHQGIARFYSDDNGENWGEPVDISESIYEQFDERADGGIRCMFIGSGKISQSKTVKVGDYYRLYCAPLVKLANGSNVNFVLYSDDFGGTWKVLGGVENSPIPSSGDEPKADELPNGNIIISSRTSGGRIYNIYAFTNVTTGEGSWGTPAWSNANNNGTVAVSNSTNGEIMFLPVTRKEDNKNMYLMLQSVPFGSGRANVGIYYKELESLEDFVNADSIAKNWDGSHQASYLGSAYSTMCWQADNTLAFVYEEETHSNASRGGYTIVYKNYSIEQITDSAYTYNPQAKAHDVVKAGIDVLKIEAGEGKYVGEYKAEAVEEVDNAIEAYKANPSNETYVAINKALAQAARVEAESGLIYRLRNIERSNGTLYINPENTRFTAATSNLGNADQIFTFVPATNEKEFYLYNLNYGLYLGKLTAQETQPAVTANAAEAGTWKIESAANGISKPINTNRTSGGLDGLHLAGDNTRLVPWYSTAAASQWYIEIVTELPITIPADGYATANLPFAVQLPAEMKAYVPVAPTELNGELCMYIEELGSTTIPANTPVILAAEAGTYMMQFALDNTATTGEEAVWKGTLRSETIAGTVYTLSGSDLVKGNNLNVPANTAYYSAEMEADRVPLSNEKSTTGIDGIVADGDEENVIFYDLNGRRVAKPQKGIYIANGKKIFFE